MGHYFVYIHHLCQHWLGKFNDLSKISLVIKTKEAMIKYLRLDAEYGGSGLQDTEGIDVDIMTLPLSDATVYKLKVWLNQYWYALTNTKSLLDDYISLDKEGLALKQDIQKDLHAHDLDYLVLYWSEGRGCFLNDEGNRIRDVRGLMGKDH